MCCFHNKTEIEIMQGLNQRSRTREENAHCQQIVYQKYLQIYISFSWDSDATQFQKYCTYSLPNWASKKCFQRLLFLTASRRVSCGPKSTIKKSLKANLPISVKKARCECWARQVVLLVEFSNGGKGPLDLSPSKMDWLLLTANSFKKTFKRRTASSIKH